MKQFCANESPSVSFAQCLPNSLSAMFIRAQLCPHFKEAALHRSRQNSHHCPTYSMATARGFRSID
jgi:hypothetical protein